MTSYEKLAVVRLINADAHLTALGGSQMPPEVLDAMRQASASFVDIFDLQDKIGRQIAELTNNEACYVSSGAAAGIVLSVLACRASDDLATISRLPDGVSKREVILHSNHRIPYDRAISLAGATLVTIGNAWQTFPWELEAAINEGTAAVFYVAGAHMQVGVLSLEQTITIAHGYDIPVIVDAAAQLPPVDNLWRFTRDLDADLALFSGGKALQGPQPSGLILGRAPLVRACAANGAPHQRLARAAKTGKEEMMGILAAVERYLALDHALLDGEYEETVGVWLDVLGQLPGVDATRSFPNEAGQPIPRLHLRVDPAVAGLDAAKLTRNLRTGDPAIAVAWDEADGILATPDMLSPGDADIIAGRIRAELDAARSAT